MGAYAQVTNTGLYLDAIVGSLDGSITFRKKARGSKRQPDALGKSLARDLLKAGAKSILQEIYNISRRS
ncbi:MAG: hypothetical protein P8Y81_02165 [Ignavibacteriaceae bacterium]